MQRLLLLLLCFALQAPAATVTVTVGQGGNFFSPAFFTVNPGDTIVWQWKGGHHNTVNMTRPTGAATWSSNIDAGTTSFSYIPQVSGLYNYTCTHHSGMDGSFFVTGCSYPVKPVISTFPQNNICSGDSILLSTIYQSGATYTWLDQSFRVLSTRHDSVIINRADTYKVVVNRCGVDSTSDVIQVVVNALPQPSFTYTSSGLSYNFTNTTSPLSTNSYSWSFSDGSSAQQSLHAAHTFTNPGNYTVTLTATDVATSCRDTSSTSLSATTSVINMGHAGYSFYPNPASTILRIHCGTKSTIQLKDVYGRNMMDALSVDGNYDLDVSSIPTGLYLLYAVAESRMSIQKVFITH